MNCERCGTYARDDDCQRCKAMLMRINRVLPAEALIDWLEDIINHRILERERRLRERE